MQPLSLMYAAPTHPISLPDVAARVIIAKDESSLQALSLAPMIVAASCVDVLEARRCLDGVRDLMLPRLGFNRGGDNGPDVSRLLVRA